MEVKTLNILDVKYKSVFWKITIKKEGLLFCFQSERNDFLFKVIKKKF